MSSGWIGVDLDGTLAEWLSGQSVNEIGRPIPAMVERVKKWLAEGRNIRIFTARIAVTDYAGDTFEAVDRQRKLIEEWSLENLGTTLPITATKDYGMIELWDDRAVQLVPNTGIPVTEWRGDGWRS
jgi:hypothetical protein